MKDAFKQNSNYTFSRVPHVEKPRSIFDRSRTYKTTFNAGQLIPFYWDEILPGDTVANLNVTSFARLATPVVPFMDNLWMDFHFFFVPCRLVWDHWKNFCGEQANPNASTDYVVPTVTIGNRCTVGSLFDYFGLPLSSQFGVNVNNYKVNSLPFRCYNLIWNEFYRDENLQSSVTVKLTDGGDTATMFNVLKRGKRKSDPFRSALPFPQKAPAVDLPLGSSAPVRGNGLSLKLTDGEDTFRLGSVVNSYDLVAISSEGSHVLPYKQQTLHTLSSDYNGVGVDDSGDTGLVADLSLATAATINSLREAFQVQRWYEEAARSGTRYVELLLSMFGVSNGDATLQRPEYLGGGTTAIQVHSVAQTSATDEVTPQGNLAAYGVAGQSGIGFSKSFTEHGYVIGLVSVRADATYQQGIDRMWSRRTKFDFYWPAFAHLGEVGVLNREIFADGSDDDDLVFGYQEHWYEYRYGSSKITGKLRNNADGSLAYWHLGEFFANRPLLNGNFIEEQPPIERVIAVQDEPQFIFDSVIHCRMARVMPLYSVPGLIDHF